MKFALVNGDKTEAKPGLRGTCEICQSDTLAKCGTVRISHWAHKSKVTCDPWWENETEWHRAWKNRFPKDFQEIVHKDPETKEIHKADIKTANGLVIEFQRSAIKSAEMQSREAFYKNMVWLVDGTRLKNDDFRFCEGFGNLEPAIIDGYFRLAFPDKCFHKSWLESSKPVYFDFQGIIDLPPI
jgi:competence CoiA-like predicted nuclease